MFAPCRPSHADSSHIALDWLRQARSALTLRTETISGMSPGHLRDIGMEPRSLSSTVYREIGKTGLVDFGWRQGR